MSEFRRGVLTSTAYPGIGTKKPVHLRLTCGHGRWTSKRYTSVVCQECRKEAKASDRRASR